ncbi:N,N-dimethylformamidase beta subunit family domain-containing protein [Tautonia plasticadhaerens]|uniref:N,N-dimethylformamidase beta subunit-like C-terminal domain-containing protein n=1 Tax=Tautonia plasticadhaerens TaxID=2527974 RepID=A0A518HEW9_9BACT|nr:N,N-dimethylformamidase beta subunit family domain-containing protein [Tautonia plasticadhaerens]QDV39384.1 hypothetical protein ElP_73500 [Tautonia plasticadhaerens]
MTVVPASRPRSWTSSRRPSGGISPFMIGLALMGFAGRSHAAPEEPIVVENAKAGTTDWILDQVEVDEDQRSRAIEGFCSQASVAAGETLTVSVSTEPASSFRCRIYRMGYYGGAGARLVHETGSLPGTTQPTPDPGPRDVRECRWEPSFSLTIPGDWLSGVYLGKLTAEPSGLQSYVVFIVRDDRPADFVFQCSDLTWQAYNRWPGWSSLYDYEGNRWETRLSNDVSLDRPYSRYYNMLPIDDTAATPVVGSGEFLLWEFPLAYWMERHGYDVTYISDLDTHRDGMGLRRAKGFLSVGHDEYWTPEMFENVARARDAGVCLAFFSGNSLSGEIALDPALDGRPDRIFRRSRIFDEEEELMGASSYGVGLGDWTCRRPGHWLFEGTRMGEGDSIPGLVGWEFHGPPLRDDPSLVVLAGGRLNDSDGSELDREHAAVVYDGPEGNFVFNAATCWWSLPLSSPPGYLDVNRADFHEDDPRVQRMTRNVLDRIIEAGPSNRP